MNHHGSNAWVKASELQGIALSVVLSVALLEIVLSKHPGEVNSDSSHSRTSVTKDFEEGGRNKKCVVMRATQGKCLKDEKVTKLKASERSGK